MRRRNWQGRWGERSKGLRCPKQKRGEGGVDPMSGRGETVVRRGGGNQRNERK